jgi:large subunit ribosomal protein L23
MKQNILIKPIVTEKMTAQAEKFRRYGFIVERAANKIEIKKAVESMYGVTVDDVNTATYRGKTRMRNTKSGAIVGRTSTYKKAVVTLAKGDVIDFFSNV